MDNGNHLKRQRIEAGMSRAHLAREARIDPNRVRRIEGGAVPGADHALRIGQALDTHETRDTQETA